MGDKVVELDMGEGMQCSDHPYRNNPGGICAFCLQEKLGKLVSSSKSNNTFYPIAVPSSSSSPPSRSEGTATAAPSMARTTQIPFFVQKKKKVMSSSTLSSDATLILKRSRSVAVPRHLSSDDSPRKKSFWSFLHLSSRRQPCPAGARKDDGSSEVKTECGDENESSPNSSHASSFGRKVARSRSVGCGSRSFSGDFLERISTGLGDCALRRVESQREAKQQPKIVLHRVAAAAADEKIKEKVKCGGIFGMMGGGGSSSYWLSDDFNGGRSKSSSWGWAFASPMRAFRPSTKSYIAAAAAAAAAGRGRRDLASSSSSTSTTTNSGNNDNNKVVNITTPSLLPVTG